MSLNYVMIGSNNVAQARAFYDAVMPAIGGACIAEYLPHAVCYELRGGGRMWLAVPYNEESAAPGNGNMVGLKCDSAHEVELAYETSLAHGGTDAGAPGPRPQYGPKFFGAYVRDIDGNKLSFVHF